MKDSKMISDMTTPSGLSSRVTSAENSYAIQTNRTSLALYETRVKRELIF